MWREEFTIESKYATDTDKSKEGTRLPWYVSWYTTRDALRHKTHINPQTTDWSPCSKQKEIHTHTHTHTHKVYKTQLCATYQHLPAVKKHENTSAAPLIYSYNESQRRCTISQIYLIKYSTCFGHVHCPSSGVSQHCIHTTDICHASSVGIR